MAVNGAILNGNNGAVNLVANGVVLSSFVFE